MSNRYNTIDIAIGVGMCAILFGALLFFVAAGGTYHATLPTPIASAQPMGPNAGMAWLQPALGQAIVEQSIAERRMDHAIAVAASDWNRATLARQAFIDHPEGRLGAVMRDAVAIPADHMARVQAVMGRAIVQFTMRGVKHGLLSADLPRSAFNLDMIRTTETRGLLSYHQFVSTWQATLGRRIAEAAHDNWKQAGALQERLGTAVVRLAQVQLESEHLRAVQQEQLGGFVLAAVRTDTPADHTVSAPVVASIPTPSASASTNSVAWPEIPLGYLLVAIGMLAMIFLTGLFMAARSREEQELARIRHETSRWVYRTAP
jgi:hypothetical protein